ncbi:MAG: hypothetical protein U0641_18980 [Anaerolineae bacterium]
MTDRRRDILIGVGLLLLPFGAFFAQALGQTVFYHHDLQYYFYAYHRAVADLSQQPGLPLWNPYAFSGIPLLGDGQTAMFYPPNWLYWVLPTAYALTLSILLHFSIAGVGMYLYARVIRLSPLAGLIAALAFMFNGFLVARVVHPSIMAGAALIPLVFWSIERVLQRGSRSAFVVAALILALQLVAGHPQIPVYTVLAVGVYSLVIVAWQWRRTGARRAWLALAQVAGAYVVGGLLAAVQLVPWAELASFSPRAAGASYELVTNESLVGFDWLLYLFPYAYGALRMSPLETFIAWLNPIEIWEKHAYIGILPLALAILGGVEVGRLLRLRRVWARGAAADAEGDVARERFHAARGTALLAALALMLLIAAGRGTPFAWVVYATPVLGKLRGYVRAVAVADFALCVLAGVGVERLVRNAGRKRDWAPAAAGALVLALVAGALVMNAVVWAPNPTAYAATVVQRTMLTYGLNIAQSSAFVPLAIAVAATILLLGLSRGAPPLGAVLLVCLAAADMITFATVFNPTTSPSDFERVPAAAQFLKRDPSLYRIAVFARNDHLDLAELQQQLAYSWAMPYGLEDINGFNSLQPRRYTDVLFGTDDNDVSYGNLYDGRLLDAGNPIFGLLNVKYAIVTPDSAVIPPPDWTKVFEGPKVAIYRNPAPLARAFFVERIIAESSAPTILDNITRQGFDPQAVAYVESGLDQAAADRLAGGGAAEAQVERVSPTELRLTTRTDADRFLVLSEMWFPGWEAELVGPDGQSRPLPIYRTDYLLRGLVAPAGEHTIRVVYRPRSALTGVALTAAALVGLIALLLVPRRTRRRRQVAPHNSVETTLLAVSRADRREFGAILSHFWPPLPVGSRVDR